jgi:hypothetical protein
MEDMNLGAVQVKTSTIWKKIESDQNYIDIQVGAVHEKEYLALP